jgi:predicted transcriptional regulator
MQEFNEEFHRRNISQKAAGLEIGVSQTQVSIWLRTGVPDSYADSITEWLSESRAIAGKPRPTYDPPSGERTAKMLTMWNSGSTLAAIGDLYGITRAGVSVAIKRFSNKTQLDRGLSA